MREAAGRLPGPSGGRHPFGGHADSVTPTLKWKEFPWKDNPQISEINYDLKVLLPKGTPIYSREGLATCEHTLESPLEPGTTYLWTVRTRFRWNGERRQTQWSHLWNGLWRGPLTPEPMKVYWPLQVP